MKIHVRLVLTAVFWGGTFIAGRLVAQHLDPFATAFLRFAMASVLLLILTWKIEGRLPPVTKGQFGLIVLLGLTGIFAYNALFFSGLKHIEASRAALIIATCPAFIALASAIFLKETLRWTQVVGIPLSVIGAVVVISKGHPREVMAGGLGSGELFILGCVANWVAYSLLGKAVMRALSPLASVSYSAAVGAAGLAVAAAFEGLGANLSRASLLDWLLITYLAVFGTVIGFVWFYEGVRTLGATRAGTFINFVPVSAVILAYLILHEPVTPSLAAGAVLVFCGVYLTNKASRPPGRPLTST